ncbi:MAG: ABC transporter substrate-binding protein [Methylocystaceae bacterium]|nr:ABC transporter substrate-binding protein [Methylocystaceae bacterium]
MKRSFILLILCLTSFSTLASDPIKLVTGPDYSPFTDEKLERGGWAAALVVDAFAAVGYDVSLDWKPWKRGYMESMNAKFIGTFPYIPTVERKKGFLYSDPFYTEEYVALSNLKETESYQKYDDMIGHTICRPIGYAIPYRFEVLQKEGKISLFQPKNMSDCTDKVMKQPKHIVILNRKQAKAQFQSNPELIHQVQSHSLSEKGFTLHFIVSKQHPDAEKWIQRFNQGLKQLRKDGQIKKLDNKFGL